MVCERMDSEPPGLRLESAGDQHQRRYPTNPSPHALVSNPLAHRREDARALDDQDDDTDIEEELMRIDPVDTQWRSQLHAGDELDAQNPFGNWCPAVAMEIINGDALIRFRNMNDSWQRWIALDSDRLAPPCSHAQNNSPALRLAQQVEVRRGTTAAIWKAAHVVRSRMDSIYVRYAGCDHHFDELIAFTPENVARSGDHLHHRNFASCQRQLSIDPAPKSERSRMIQTQNPRFAHYQEALLSQGLRIFQVEGDGNCLFRSVSHQVYGDDCHYALVRKWCMDYMESEKEYFEPYVVGDMTDFLRYLNVKRHDGIWGDDPEIQAMCELYDRRAEVYAYDPTHGFRKLRTFHENSSLLRNRPAIRLSYYGGGHYDSIVGPSHEANLIREQPGCWERRHLEYSRRINTREHIDALTQLIQESDRESTEVAQLEQVLAISRSEFDAMHSTLEDTLKLSLEGQRIQDRNARADDEEMKEASRMSEMASIQAELIQTAKEISEEEELSKAIEASLNHHEQVSHGTTMGKSNSFDDNELSVAIEASLVSSDLLNDNYDEELRKALELSSKEVRCLDTEDDADEMEELQRAIQASLQDS